MVLYNKMYMNVCYELYPVKNKQTNKKYSAFRYILYSHWIREVMYHIKLERIRYTIRGSTRKFHNVWQPFLIFVDVNMEADNMVNFCHHLLSFLSLFYLHIELILNVSVLVSP